MIDRDSEIDVAARTTWGEARGEGRMGMTAVLCVITNRLNIAKLYEVLHGKPHPLYGDGTFKGACKSPLQFSCWNANDPNFLKLLSVTETDPLFLLAVSLAGDFYDGGQYDITYGSTNYYAATMPAPPKWAAGIPVRARIGNHIFLKM